MIAFTDGGCGNVPPFRCFFTLRRMNADGSNEAFIQGNAFAPLNDPDWGSFRVEDIGYPRPLSATPLLVPLVLAYDRCTQPNRTHGPPLASPSCAPPVQSSTPTNPEASGLTVGTVDANGEAPRSVGSIALRVAPGDVRIDARLTDVKCRVAFFACPGGPLSDYAGELQGRLTSARITDHEGAPATIADLAPIPFALSCAATPASDAGATCSASTTLNTLIPGVVAAGKRAVWQFGRTEVWDGGGDGEAATDDNELFVTQGVFVP
jgi:hypothetical protein